MKSGELFLLFAVILAALVQEGRSEIWTSNNVDTASAAMSVDGRVFVAAGGATLISYDYGATWHTNNFVGKAAAISANGTNIIVAGAVPAQTWLSSDAGSTWTSYPAPTTITVRQIACSSDGTRVGMVLFASNPIFLSTNGGVAWSTNSDAPAASWTGIASSADGRRLLATSQNTGLWRSTNCGLNWSALLASNNLAGVACSIDGKTVVVASSTDVVYVSSDFGETWSWQHVSTFGGSGAACSADGSRLGVISYAGVFVSTNSGQTWTQENVNELALNAIATSADGHRWIAGHSGGQGRIFCGRSTPSPALQIIPANRDVSISWTIQSSPFILQRAQEMPFNQSSWSALPDAPALNLNTLRNQITVPATNSSAFFRLSGT